MDFVFHLIDNPIGASISTAVAMRLAPIAWQRGRRFMRRRKQQFREWLLRPEEEQEDEDELSSR